MDASWKKNSGKIMKIPITLNTRSDTWNKKKVCAEQRLRTIVHDLLLVTEKEKVSAQLHITYEQ